MIASCPPRTVYAQSGLATIALVATLLFMPVSAEAQDRVLGIDVSAWQGNISQTTWNNIHNVEGRDFVFIRSSRGGTTGFYNQSNKDNDDPPGENTLSQRYDDPYFVQNITRATAAGMLAGPYHFARPDIVESTPYSGGIANTGTDEADHFIEMAGAWMRPGYLLPVFDLESGNDVRTPNELAQFSIDFSDRIFEVFGIRPTIYSGNNYTSYVQNASFALRTELVAAFPNLWIARWPTWPDIENGHPGDYTTTVYGPWDDPPNPTHPWSFWQYTSSLYLDSFNNGSSRLDANVAQGGIEFVKDKLVPALWTGGTSGDWSTLLNWNSGQTPVAPVPGPGQVPPVGVLTLPTARLPGADDTVILDDPDGSFTVTLSSGSHNIRKLYVREALDITGGSLSVNYEPSADSTPISAQFSAPVSLNGFGSLSIHTLQVDAGQDLTVSGGLLSFDTLNLMPDDSSPARLLVSDSLSFFPLGTGTSSIANGSGGGSTGVVDLGGGNRTFAILDGSADVDLSIDVPLENGGLIKSGPGTLELTGLNTYSGDTAIQGGELSIQAAFLEDTSDVLLTTGATLNLDFVGTDEIDSLIIDGVEQTGGTWGAIGSGAPHTTPLITGSGLLKVSLPGDLDGDGDVDLIDLFGWKFSFPSTTPNSGDADGDGDTDIDDLMIIQRNYTGPLALSASVAVPEPASLGLFTTAVLITAGRARRRR